MAQGFTRRGPKQQLLSREYRGTVVTSNSRGGVRFTFCVSQEAGCLKCVKVAAGNDSQAVGLYSRCKVAVHDPPGSRCGNR
ncbi:MAG: hypothetical protein KatS3mg107_0321 [Gemmataceae bacterium]|nr:MAG: hypothetical protein KatS3mg107_0321 [Gemmataceae bacterium]